MWLLQCNMFIFDYFHRVIQSNQKEGNIEILVFFFFINFLLKIIPFLIKKKDKEGKDKSAAHIEFLQNFLVGNFQLPAKAHFFISD